MSELKSCLYCCAPIGGIKYRGVADRLQFVEGHRIFVECTYCKSLMLSPFPSSEQVLNYYPKKYNLPQGNQVRGVRKVIAYLEFKFFKYCYYAELKRVCRKVSDKTGQRIKVLEVGCGNGIRLEILSKLNADAIGVDISEGDISAAKAKGLSVVLADVNNLQESFNPKSFDLVMLFDVLEHIPDLELFFQKLRTLVRPRGWIVVGVPAQECFGVSILGKKWAAISEAPRHVTLPAIKGVKALFERHGLKSLEIQPYSALSCSMVLGMSLASGASGKAFYGSEFKVLTLLKRICGGLIMLFFAPLFFFENRYTDHPSRFVVCGQLPE